MVDLYAVNIQDPISKEQLNYFLSIISEKKRERVLRFVFPEDAKRTLYGDIIIRSIAGKRLMIDGRDIEYRYNSYGKPYIDKYPEFYFNITHSGDWVICAVSNDLVGVDIELIKDVDIDLAKRFFSFTEYKWLINKPLSMQREYFYSLWTLKESYIKCLGKGLSIPLDSFCFYINNETDITISDSGYGFSFRQFNMHNNYKLSVTAKEKDINDRINYIDIASLT